VGGRFWLTAFLAVMLAVLVIELFYLLVVHDEPQYLGASQHTAQESPGADETPPEIPTETNAPNVSEVGQTRAGENSDTTLLQTRLIHPPADRLPPSGEEWFGIRARTCLHPGASPSGGLPWSSWAVVDGQGSRYRGSDAPWADYPPQQLPTTGLRAGACHVGWVLVAVPEGAGKRIETVVFRLRSPNPAEWAV